MSGSWYSQAFRPDGGITAEGLRNQLGRPALSLPTVLVRESAQNSWDARSDHADRVDFTMELASVSPARADAWRRLLSSGVPSSDPDVFPLRRALREPSMRYLTVSDRGTKGLGGPTRSDQAAEPGRRNWLSFVLNSGEARDTEGGGGTYGYGKGVFFLASRVGAVLIHTRFLDDEGAFRTRFIGSSLWASYALDGRPFTGRHWWGAPQEGHCEPLVDAAADDVARALGLPAFDDEATGTTVTIIEPNLLDPTVPEEEAQQLPPAEAGRYLAEAMAWNLWPLTLRDRGQRLIPKVLVGGEEVAVPSEDSDPLIAHFAAAYRRLKVDGEPMECKRPRRLLGKFAVERTFGARTRSKAASDLGLVDDLAAGESLHHVCLMRAPELVVRYLPGPTTSHPDIGYTAVLRVSDDLDHVFAKSEPPTHDAWIDSQLHGQEATFVRVAHRRVKERLDEIAGARRNILTVGEQPVGGVARQLGQLLAGVAATGAGVGGPVVGAGTGAGGFTSLMGGTGGQLATAGAGVGAGARSSGQGGRGPGRPRLEGTPRFVDAAEGTVLEQTVRLPGAGTFAAAVHVVTGDGRLESEPYADAPMPTIIGWRGSSGTVSVGEELTVSEPCDVTLLVRPVADGTLDISVRGT